MDLVIDANILFAIMIKKGITEKILLSNEIHLYAPEYLFIEFKKHEKEILEITKRTGYDFQKLMEILERRIEIIPIIEFKKYVNEAESLLEDKNDAAYLAVCLAKKMPLWSNDKGFKKQNKVRIYNTQELIMLFELE